MRSQSVIFVYSIIHAVDTPREVASLISVGKASSVWSSSRIVFWNSRTVDAAGNDSASKLSITRTGSTHSRHTESIYYFENSILQIIV